MKDDITNKFVTEDSDGRTYEIIETRSGKFYMRGGAGVLYEVKKGRFPDIDEEKKKRNDNMLDAIDNFNYRGER